VAVVTERAAPVRRTDPLLVLCSIASVQCGSALARTAFDDLGATGVTALRLGLSGRGRPPRSSACAWRR
jgi:threonine/homoserine efflux transporter RhtA